MRMTLPSFDGFSPISEERIAFSISFIVERSNGCATISAGSGTDSVATWLSGIFDPSTMKEIEKSIRASDLGLNPSNDGKVIRIPIPPLTDERRKELSRHVHKQAEEGRNVVRNVRRDANERLKKLLKDHKISEDDERKGLEHVQKMTDDHVKLIDDLQKKKDQDLLGH